MKQADQLELLRRQDSAAWEALCRQLVDDMFGFVVRLLQNNRSAADDVVQETWLEAIQRIGSFDPTRGELRAWLFHIARMRVIRHWRSAGSVMATETMRRLSGHSAEQNLQEPAADDMLPIDLMESVDRAALVRAALLMLSPDDRQVLNAKYVDDLSVASIAQMVGKSAKAVESMLTRARAQLRGLLGPHFYPTRRRAAQCRPSDESPVAEAA